MKANHSKLAPSNRRYDLDWVRTLVVLLVLPFHGLLVFVQNPGSVVYMKDTLDCFYCDRVAGFIAVWQMQLLFVIAGMSTAFALAKRGSGPYLRERVLRLLVPLLFGVATLVPAMTYLTQIAQGKSLTFWQHYANFFTFGDITGLSGNFTPAHLWFILFLFLFSVIALPLFRLLKTEQSQGAIRGMAWLFEKPIFGLLLLGLPIVTAGRIEFMGAQNPIYYLVVFITGYLLTTDERYQKAIDRDWPLILLLGVALEMMRQTGQPFTIDNTPARALRDIALEYNDWAWVLAILGMGHRFINFGSSTLSYFSAASYPFYIMHLLVLTVVTYFGVAIQAGIMVKYLVIIAVSFAITLLAYEAARRIPPLRFLLGMKAGQPQPQVTRKEALTTA